MKIISYNSRGLGDRLKKQEVQRMVVDHKPDLICLQETKLEEVDSRLCCLLWGSYDCVFSFKKYEGGSSS